MTSKTLLWIKKGIATVISGGAGAVTAVMSASMIAPDKFNFGPELGNFFKLAVVTFAVNGFLGLMLYLKASPIPEDATNFMKRPEAKQ